MVVGGQRAGDGLAGGPVVPDRGGHREEALPDPDADAVDAAAAVQLQVELPFQGVEDRFDELADRLSRCSPGCGVRLR